MDEMSVAVANALKTVATECTDVLGAVAPVALTVAGAYLVWKIGIKFFKGLIK